MEQLRLTLPELEQEEQQIRENLGGIVKNFVRTGWHLSRIERSGAYKLKGFSTISEYARTTFGMAPDGVSRFMNVYERYSIPGDTPELREEYRKFNFSQLTEMLQLPKEDHVLIRPETKREDIRDLKKFNKQNNPDNLLNWQQEPDDIVREAVRELFKHRKKDLNGIYEQYGLGPYPEETVKAMARFLYHEKKKKFQTDKVFMMLYPDQVFIKNSNGELNDIAWPEFFQIMGSIFDGAAAGKDTWENYFNPDPAGDFEEQIPGQDNILNHPECIPGKLHGRKFEHCIYLPEEDCISKDCGSCEKKELLEQQEAREQAEQKNGRCLYHPESPCTLTAEQKATPGDGENCGEKCCWNCSVEGCKYECNVSADRRKPKEQEEAREKETEVLPEEAEIAPAQTEEHEIRRFDAWPSDLGDIPIPSMKAIRDYLMEEEKLLKDYLECGDLPEQLIQRQQLKVAGLRMIRNLTEDAVEEEPEQPELPRLKNNEERKEWIRNYKNWPLRHIDTYTGAKYYEFRFENGAVLVAEVWEEQGDKHMPDHESVYMHLIGGPEPPKGQYGYRKWTKHKKFERYQDNETALVEFLKEIQR